MLVSGRVNPNHVSVRPGMILQVVGDEIYMYQHLEIKGALHGSVAGLKKSLSLRV